MRGEIDINSEATEVEPSACSSSKPYDPTISFVEQTAAGLSVRPLYAPACAWFRPLPHDGQSAAENEKKKPRGDLQVKLASAEDELYQDPGSHRIQTPDEVLHKVAAASSAAAEARKRRKELTKLKHHHVRTKTS